MLTGVAREMQVRDPRKVRVVYERPRFHESWLHNPRIAQKGEIGDFQDLVARDHYLRPYIAAKSGDRWTWKAYGPPAGELYFSPDEQYYGERHAGRVVIEPHIKAGASPNKEWGWNRWAELSDRLQARGVRVTQLGPEGTQSLQRVERIRTPSMRAAAAVLANARAAVLPEGGLHHVCAAVHTPAVVIFGGYIAPEVTGYQTHLNIFTGGAAHPLGCGMRAPCLHCRDAMAQITPSHVCDQLMRILHEERGRRVAT